MAEKTSKRKRKRRVNKKQEQPDRQKLIETIDLVKSIEKIEWGGGKPTGEKTEDGKGDASDTAHHSIQLIHVF